MNALFKFITCCVLLSGQMFPAAADHPCRVPEELPAGEQNGLQCPHEIKVDSLAVERQNNSEPLQLMKFAKALDRNSENFSRNPYKGLWLLDPYSREPDILSPKGCYSMAKDFSLAEPIYCFEGDENSYSVHRSDHRSDDLFQEVDPALVLAAKHAEMVAQIKVSSTREERRLTAKNLHSLPSTGKRHSEELQLRPQPKELPKGEMSRVSSSAERSFSPDTSPESLKPKKAACGCCAIS